MSSCIIQAPGHCQCGGCAVTDCVLFNGSGGGATGWCSVCLDGPFSITFDVSVGGATVYAGSDTGAIYAPGTHGSESWNYVRVTIEWHGGISPYVSLGFGYSLTSSVTITALASLVSGVCDPFSGHVLLIGYSGSPTPLNAFYALGVRDILFQGIASPTGGCYPTFQVTGCGGLPLAGADIDIWNNSGKSIHYGSATTTSSTNTIVPISTFDENFYYEVAKSRFTTASGNQDGINPRDAIPVSMTPAATYHCLAGCPDPLPATLHETHSIFGAITLTWDSTNWSDSFSYTTAGCNGCPAETVTVTCTLNASTGAYTESWTSQ